MMDESTVNARKALEAKLIDRAMKDAAFREELVRDPKAVFARELGISVPDSIHVQVLEESSTTVYLVLPQAPASAGTELSDQELEAVAGGWSATTAECGTCGTCNTGPLRCPGDCT
jgi:hypothetical protein